MLMWDRSGSSSKGDVRAFPETVVEPIDAIAANDFTAEVKQRPPLQATPEILRRVSRTQLKQLNKMYASLAPKSPIPLEPRLPPNHGKHISYMAFQDFIDGRYGGKDFFTLYGKHIDSCPICTRAFAYYTKPA